MEKKSAKQLVAEMEALQVSLREPVTVWVCNCCGRIAQVRTQTYDHPAMRDRSLTQVECLTKGCNNEYWTRSYRVGEDNSQVLDMYTPVTMDESQVERFIKSVDFKVRTS